MVVPATAVHGYSAHPSLFHPAPPYKSLRIRLHQRKTSPTFIKFTVYINFQEITVAESDGDSHNVGNPTDLPTLTAAIPPNASAHSTKTGKRRFPI